MSKENVDVIKSVGTVLIDLIDLKEVKKNRPW